MRGRLFYNDRKLRTRYSANKFEQGYQRGLSSSPNSTDRSISSCHQTPWAFCDRWSLDAVSMVLSDLRKARSMIVDNTCLTTDRKEQGHVAITQSEVFRYLPCSSHNCGLSISNKSCWVDVGPNNPPLAFFFIRNLL